MKQKIFNFKFSNQDNKNNFYVNETNHNAYFHLLNNNKSKIYLTGPKKSGKSLLGSMWQKKNDAILFNNNFEFLLNTNTSILVDNFNDSLDQEQIFHLINHCHFKNLKLLIISEYTIKELSFSFDDLSSRIKIFDLIKINQPDDDMLLNILTKFFTDKQFIINSKEIFEFIIKRSKRSYNEMFMIVEKLDKLSLEKKRELTIPLIKEIL